MVTEKTTAPTMPQTLRRRGLVGGAAALVAALVAKGVAESPRVAALTLDDRYIAYGNGGDGFSTFAGGNPRVLFFDRGVFAQGTTAGVQGDGAGNNGVGVIGNSTSSHGVIGNGYGDTSAGLFGNGNGANGTGVFGYGNGSGSGVFGGGGLHGVKGAVNDTGYGVRGVAGSGYGVFGTAPGGIGVGGDSSSNVGVSGRAGGDTSGNLTGFPIGVRGSIPNGGYAMYGVTAGNGYGVYGTAAGGTGVGGVSNGGIGMYGTSTTGIGVYGVHSDASGSGSPYGVVGSVTGVGIGIYGVVTTAGAVAFAGGAGVAGAIAAQFSGPVNIFHTSTAITNGNLYIQGNYTAGGTKSAAVPHPDGTHRLLYCMESPEAWFEDFGEGTLAAGKAEVTLDADFAAVVDTSTLQVFPVSHDAHHALHIAGRSATGFTVGAVPSTTGMAAGKRASDLSGRFGYRVVAKRKDVPAPRLAKFTVPGAAATPAPAVPPAPKEPPKR